MEPSVLQHNLDTIWIIAASALVFFMQAGFSCLETGLVRAKNSINVAIKNVSDLVFSMVGYWFLGFGLMFGTSFLGLTGITGFGLMGHDTPDAYTFFLFQAVFAGTAVTIVSGAMAERVRFKAYLVAALVIGSVIYPLFGHWAWGGAFIPGEDGWLKAIGFHDFAGSSVVHSIGGWAGLAGAVSLGPRLGRFDDDGKPVQIPGYNLALAALGIFILWFGWFGFNGGSTLRGDTSVSLILVNTNISAAMGGAGAFFLSLIVAKRPLVEKLLNGILGGLVGITAGCDLVSPGSAALIGLGGGCVAYLAEDLLIKLRVDDPVGAVAAHGFCGVWGTLVLALAAPAASLPTGSHVMQLLVQSIGSVTAFIWSFGSSSILFWLLKELGALRVSREDEITGLNISEHGARMSWVETVTTIKHILDTGDLSKRVDVEVGTEMGEVAQSLNVFLDDVESAASVARMVAEGDLSTEVRPKSDMDILGQATARMVEGLRKAKLSRRQAMAAIGEIVKTGDLTRRLKVDPDSEMAAVADSFNILLESILEVASVARSVSEGDLSRDVTPKSDKDILAQATRRMVESLRAAKLSRESVIQSLRGIVATGDLSRRVTAADDPDMAAVAQSFNTLLAEILDAAEIARKVAHGDLSRKVAVKSDKDILGLAVNTMVESLHNLLFKVDGVARALSDSVLRLDSSSQELEASNTDIVQSIGRAADLVDRSIHAVQAMNLQAQAGAEAKEETQGSISEVGMSLSHLAETIKSFAASADSISRITETIQAIADQTNLLALNATIQAVGAGEAGRGFAVVAHEIKELARESTKASEEVVRLVESVRSDSSRAVDEALRSEESTLRLSMDMSRSLSETFDGIRGAVAEVTDKMESVVLAADEQNLVIGKNAKAVRSISAISRILRDQADALTETMGGFVLNNKR